MDKRALQRRPTDKAPFSKTKGQKEGSNQGDSSNTSLANTHGEGSMPKDTWLFIVFG